MADGSIDAVVCDPPYNLSSSGTTNPGRTSWAYFRTAVNTEPVPEGKVRRPKKSASARGFMGMAWDGTGIIFTQDLWCEVYRVLAPGGVIKAFGGTRTYHRMALAMEEAGFVDVGIEAWAYGSGFAKGLNIGKAIDKMAGADGDTHAAVQAYLRECREALRLSKSEVDKLVFGGTTRYSWVEGRGGVRSNEVYLPTPEEWFRLKPVLGLDDRFDAYIQEAIPSREHRYRADGGKATLVGTTSGDWGYQKGGERWDGTQRVTTPHTEAARQWEGWNTALKPAWEPVVVARKPVGCGVSPTHPQGQL